MSHTPGPLRANIVATKDGMYSIRDTRGERVGLAFTRDDALLWSQAPALLAACKVALTYCRATGCKGDGPNTVLGDLLRAIDAATKD